MRYLSGLGLDTHLSRPGGSAHWDERAQAGFEDLPLSGGEDDLPYVIKLPWAYQIIDQILSNPKMRLDAVVIPTRELVEASASRSIVELQTMHHSFGWLADVDSPWEHWGTTPGGIIYSVSPVDQARLLAVGFHHLIERVVRADVPLVLLSFARLMTEPDYLFAKLRSWLPSDITVVRAREVHAATFSFDKVRTGSELTAGSESGSALKGFAESGLIDLENIALRRELKQLRRELENLHRQEVENLRQQELENLHRQELENLRQQEVENLRRQEVENLHRQEVENLRQQELENLRERESERQRELESLREQEARRMTKRARRVLSRLSRRLQGILTVPRGNSR